MKNNGEGPIFEQFANPPEKEDFSRGIETIPPTVDLFLSDKVDDSPLPPEIVMNQALIEQARARRELLADFEGVFTQIPDPTMDAGEVIEKGLLDEEKLDSIYQDLTNFLQSDENNRRILLYLPLELIPEKTPDLSESQRQFIANYHEGWKKLLFESDVRANFVDGNIIESEVSGRRPQRVRKAAHLLPELVRKKLISPSEILQLLEMNDPGLQESIADALSVLFDLSLIPEEDRTKFEAYLKDSSPVLPQEEQFPDTEGKSGEDLLNYLLTEFGQKLYLADAQYERDKQAESPTIKARVEWERADRKDKAVLEVAGELSKALAESLIDQRGLISFINIGEAPAVAGIITLRDVLEEKARQDPEQAKAIFANCESTFEQLWQGKSARIKEALLTLWSHLVHLKVLPSDYLTRFGQKMPDLAKPNAEKEIDIETEKLKPIIEKIKIDPLLQQNLYPTVIFFGSRLKGYSSVGADLDLAILVKPGTDLDARQTIKDHLRGELVGIENLGKIVDFWLEENDDSLTIKDMPNIDSTIADSNWAHVIMGGVWLGDKNATEGIYQQIITDYIRRSKQMTSKGMDKRTIWLEEMEREALQYRLMHKGYSRYFPRRDSINTEHSNNIDSQSTFWDSGYRRIATQLFLQKVFLPEIDL